MKFESTEVWGFRHAIRGMRKPMMSHDKSDSYCIGGNYYIGPNDMKLAQNLIRGGAEHRKFLRMVHVGVDIIAPVYVLAELDTYKIGTTRNSSSFMHKGVSAEFTKERLNLPNDERLNGLVEYLSDKRSEYLLTKDPAVFEDIRKVVPMSFEYNTTFDLNYEVIRNMYFQRRNHRLSDWNTDFIYWVKSLPYAEELIMYDGGDAT